MPALFESLTQNFYRWEKRGRGWQVWPHPVELEPVFEPFFHAYSSPRPPILDDARKPTRVGSWIGKLANRLTDSADNFGQSSQYSEPEPIEPEPEYFYDNSPLVEIQIALSPDQKIGKETAERFILSLTSLRRPTSFEVIGTPNSIIVQIVCREPDSRLVRQQLQAYFPESVISTPTDYLKQHWSEHAESVVIDFGLSHEFMRPLRVFKGFEVDPLIGITGAISNLEPGEMGILQVLFQPARKAWAESITRSVTDWEGHSFFIDAPEMVGLAREKLEHPLFAVVVRIGALASDLERTRDIAISLGGALAQFSRPGSNELIPLDNDDYDDFAHEGDLLLRQSHRRGMLLNATELVSLAHLPSESVRSEKLHREMRKTKAAPSLAAGHELVLGENAHQGKTTSVTLSPEQRLRHMHVIGATGTGKSTLLLNLIIQDIENGQGVGVIDPHGDLIDQVLGYVPEKRFDDVILFDPADAEYPIGFNVLSAHSELEKNILSSDLGAVFRRLSTSWGDQMTSVLGNAILAFLESSKGGTLSDLRHFLLDQDFRGSFLRSVKDPEVVYFWQKEFPLLSGRPQLSVLTRLDTFLRPKIIRNMVSQNENRINFHEVINKGKILLVKLAQGLIGEENAHLLGAFIVSKLHQVVMGRQEIAEGLRQNFYLYVDEFQNFITPSMAAILSGARKYHLGLVLSHQDLEQLWKRDSEVASSVISNPSTRVCFRLGDFDAKKLQEGFSTFSAEDLQNLGIGEAICRIERAEYDFNLKTLPLPALDADLAVHRRGRLIILSREKYARRREEVEAEFSKQWAKAQPEEPDRSKPEEQPKAAPPPPEKEKPEVPKEEFHSPPQRPRPDVRTKVKQEPRPKPAEPPPLGRGGQQHKYLQNLIKRIGEDKGYKATIEKEILGGVGSIDVALERDGKQLVACEICITTNVEHEIQNVQKCLAAGYEHVICVSTDKKTLNKAKELATEAVSEQDFDRVQYLTPEEFLSFLESLDAKAASKEATVRGYKVKVKYRAVGEDEKKARKKAVAETVLKALRRINERTKDT